MAIKTCPECGLPVVTTHTYGSGKFAPCPEHADAAPADADVWSAEDEEAADFPQPRPPRSEGTGVALVLDEDDEDA